MCASVVTAPSSYIIHPRSSLSGSLSQKKYQKVRMMACRLQVRASCCSRYPRCRRSASSAARGRCRKAKPECQHRHAAASPQSQPNPGSGSKSNWILIGPRDRFFLKNYDSAHMKKFCCDSLILGLTLLWCMNGTLNLFNVIEHKS